MADVAQKIITANTTKNNGVVVSVTPRGVSDTKQRGINQAIPMSGINGQTTDGYLDIRFDDTTYYTS
jgi:hypothetical protein